MILENIPLGRTLEIYIDREGYRYRLVSKVEDASAKRVCVTLIAANGRAFQIRAEDDIRLVYRDEDQIWEWPQVKGGLTRLDDTPVHYFEISNPGRSFNRRNAYRVALNEHIEIGYYISSQSSKKYSDSPVFGALLGDKEGKEKEKEEEEVLDPEAVVPRYVKGMIKDVSETGIGIYTDFEFDTGDGLFLDLPSDYGLLEIKATVIRKDELMLRASNQRYKYYYGCVYHCTDRRLIKMIYDIQRETLKRNKYRERTRGKAKEGE